MRARARACVRVLPLVVVRRRQNAIDWYSGQHRFKSSTRCLQVSLLTRLVGARKDAGLVGAAGLRQWCEQQRACQGSYLGANHLGVRCLKIRGRAHTVASLDAFVSPRLRVPLNGVRPSVALSLEWR